MHYLPGSFGTPFAFNFQPELKLQYDRVGGGDARLSFIDEKEALRLGPEFTFVIRPQFVPENLSFLRNMTGRLTYHRSEDLLSGRRFTWLDTSLIYNIDPEGFLALAASYRRGDVEETGEKADIFKIGLTGKI